jgi:UDP-N-acetylmuramoyl-tripeptide--D-alanyl-D-alanine ligase
MIFSSDQIAAATGGELVRAAASGAISTDTRKLEPGMWFVALVGPKYDGHDHVDAALAAEAAGVVVHRDVTPTAGGLVRVANTTRAVQDLGRLARDRLTGPVVGITGSAGKTTTRTLTTLALSPMGFVQETAGNLNNHLGVPLTLCGGREDADATVLEMGTSAPGEIALLADIGRPNVRLVVNVGPSHLLELGGLDGVQREKGAMFETARSGDVCCVNLDDPRVAAMPIPAGATRLTWGKDPTARVRLLDARVDAARLLTQARYDVGGAHVRVEIPTPGLHVAHNAAGALAIALALDVDPHDAADAMREYKPVGMRLAVEQLPKGIRAINDAYNANPTSMEASLRTLAGLDGRRVAVLGDMLELGGEEAYWHSRIARFATSLGLDRVVLVGPRMAATDIPVDAKAEDAADLVDGLVAWLRPGDTVLFKGSRGARVERVLNLLRDALASESA